MSSLAKISEAALTSNVLGFKFSILEDYHVLEAFSQGENVIAEKGSYFSHRHYNEHFKRISVRLERFN